MYDLVIHRAHVFDGHAARTGLHDVAVNGGEIAAISGEPLRGAKEVDASAGWVMPGLMNTHLHLYDVRAVTDAESMRRFEEDELPGLLALFLHLIVLTADPTRDIGNLRELGMTILNGEIVVDRSRA